MVLQYFFRLSFESLFVSFKQRNDSFGFIENHNEPINGILEFMNLVDVLLYVTRPFERLALTGIMHAGTSKGYYYADKKKQSYALKGFHLLKWSLIFSIASMIDRSKRAFTSGLLSSATSYLLS